MANKVVFGSAARRAPPVTAVNEAGGVAYALPAKSALAQLASTGCINGTYYADAEAQLATVLDLAAKCADAAYVAKVAVYARQHGRMKDMPALLVGWLACQPGVPEPVFAKAFDACIDTGKQVANVVQMIRSGTLGRKAIPRPARRAIKRWLARLDAVGTLRASIGYSSPSFADVLRMVRPKPATEAHQALYGWLSGRNPKEKAPSLKALPEDLQYYLEWITAPEKRVRELPNVPWSMLTSHDLSPEQWATIAARASWQTLRMNLNTMLRQKALSMPRTVELIARRLKDPELIAQARPMPYQLLAAYKHVSDDMPRRIVDALHDAMELATKNVPVIEGGVAVFPDCSGSMDSPITGTRKGSDSKVLCRDVAGLVAAALVRANPDAIVMPFTDHAMNLKVEPRDSVMTTTKRIASSCSGGTNCASALALANACSVKARVCIYVSDNESWLEGPPSNLAQRIVLGSVNKSTATMREWIAYKARVPNAVLVNINLQPYPTTQAPPRPDILNVGGFSDAVFELIALAATGELTATSWEDKIAAIEL